jgi:hypothetical protein
MEWTEVFGNVLHLAGPRSATIEVIDETPFLVQHPNTWPSCRLGTLRGADFAHSQGINDVAAETLCSFSRTTNK